MFRYLIFSCYDLVNCYFCLFYCPSDLRCSECNVILLYVLCLFSVLPVCELCGETIRNMFGCDCYFVVECYEVV